MRAAGRRLQVHMAESDLCQITQATTSTLVGRQDLLGRECVGVCFGSGIDALLFLLELNLGLVLVSGVSELCFPVVGRPHCSPTG